MGHRSLLDPQARRQRTTLVLGCQRGLVSPFPRGPAGPQGLLGHQGVGSGMTARASRVKYNACPDPLEELPGGAGTPYWLAHSLVCH